MKKIVVILIVVIISGISLADEKSEAVKIFYKGDGIVVDQDDFIMEKKVLSDNLIIDEEQIIETILANKLFSKEVLKKYNNDKEFNKRFSLAKAKYLGTFYRQELKKKVQVNEDVIKSYYLSSPEKFITKKAYKLQVTSHNLKVIAEKNYTDLIKGKRSFNEIASSESDHEKSASENGNIGWILENKMPVPFRNAVKELEENDISKPLLYGREWLILKIVEIREPEKIPFNESVKVFIKEELQAKHWNALIKEEVERLKNEYHIQPVH